MLGFVLGLWEGEVTFVTPFLEPAWLPAWGPHHRPVRSMTVPHSLTKPVWLMWMWGSLSGQWEGEVTLSHPPGTGGAPSIHDIYLSYILYYLAINHYQLNTMMIMPTPSQCTGWTEVQLRQISPTCHVIITSQDALNIKSQTGDGPNLPIYPFFWLRLRLRQSLFNINRYKYHIRFTCV